MKKEAVIDRGFRCKHRYIRSGEVVRIVGKGKGSDAYLIKTCDGIEASVEGSRVRSVK